MTQSELVQCVLDASVAIKWYVNEIGSDVARELLGRIMHLDSQTHVPSHFYIESANVLWTCVRRNRLSHEKATEAMATLAAVDMRIAPIERLSEAALALSLEHGVAAYDAAYLALAELL
jgi:predicted nucleic acid-binding protein